MIIARRAGFQTSVQDLGRPGYRHMGIGLGGAMDRLALSVGNLLLGNPVNAAGLEITMGQAEFIFTQAADIALTGAAVAARLDGRSLPGWWSCRAQAGQCLRLNTVSHGVRSYLCVRGGIDVPQVLGSASTDLKGGFGGFQGRALRNGDVLAVSGRPASGGRAAGLGLRDPRARAGARDGSAGDDEGFSQPQTQIRLLPGAQWDHLSACARRRLLAVRWQVSAQSNRVGCRLEGPALAYAPVHDMRSHGIVPGVMQLPPDGRPVVQLCDGNTSGGYPVIAHVIQTDLDLFAQLRPGACVQFVMASLAQARQQQVRWQQYLAALAWRCQSLRESFF